MILAAFALIYLHVLVIILLLWLTRTGFNLSLRGFAASALDLLICPPFALNIVRRLSLQIRVDEDFIHAARRLLGPADWEAAQAEAVYRLDGEIACEEEGAPRIAALQQRRSDLMREDTACPVPKSS